jgi:hypothetical protein
VGGEKRILRNFKTCSRRNYNYNNQVKEDEMARACSTIREERNVHRLFVGKPEGKKPL